MMGQSFQVLVQVSFGVTPAVIYLLAGHLGAGSDGSMSAGTLVAFTTLQARLLFPMVNLMRTALDFNTSLAAFERVFEYLDLVPEIADAPDATDLTQGEDAGSVSIESVFFRYDAGVEVGLDRGSHTASNDSRPWTLANVSMEVAPGQLAALVGPSGSGKTTLTYLIPRLFDADRGKIKLDGHDVRQVRQRSLAQAIGMVTQETYLFHGTIRDNLKYANYDATDSEVLAAARAANIHELIASFPEGYDTVVGERGYRLSGGEKQRLSIARVILKNPRFLILDEATLALDSANEKLVQDALSKVMHGRTTIAIAHRLSTVMAADIIFVMDRGRVVEHGQHRELLAHRGLYAALYQQQFTETGTPAGRDR
jgi:ATP-binding cassette subfamily B protein